MPLSPVRTTSGTMSQPRLLSLALLACAALLVPLLAGCPPSQPWQGVTASEYARLNEHRVIGIGLLENKAFEQAAAEFAAIRKAQPSLAFGWTNEAAARLGP